MHNDLFVDDSIDISRLKKPENPYTNTEIVFLYNSN